MEQTKFDEFGIDQSLVQERIDAFKKQESEKANRAKKRKNLKIKKQKYKKSFKYKTDRVLEFLKIKKTPNKADEYDRLIKLYQY